MSNTSQVTIGKYQLLGQLAQGGMGTVYKALQPGLNRPVAIKVLAEKLSRNPDFATRFEQEAATVAALRHPNIVQIYDFDHQDQQYYLVMEFVDGSTLEAELAERQNRNQPFSQADVTRIFTAMANAIDYAHQQGIIHRDLKPGNVMLSSSGQVILTDFGIVQLLGANNDTESMTGTPSYMSPEQSQDQETDGRTDIYALGVILFELLTGQVPFTGNTPFAVIMKHISEEPPPPSSLNPNLHSAVEAVILKAMSKSPRARYQTAGEMAMALQNAVGIAPAEANQAKPLALLAPKLNLKPILGLGSTTATSAQAATPNPIDPPTQVLGPNSPSKSPPSPASVTPPRATTSVNPPTNPPNTPSQIKPPTNPPTPTGGTGMWAPPPGQPKKKTPIWLTVAVVVVLLGIVGGAFLFFSGQGGSPPETVTVAGGSTATAEALAATEALATATYETWLMGDDDRDGLTNQREIELNTLTDKRDTDEDDLDDGEEVLERGTNPLDPDTDGDGLRDGEEVSQGLNPLDADTDGDGIIDSQDEAPGQMPTPTPTETETPTPEPTQTSTPEPTETPTPEPTDTPEAEATEASSAPANPQPAPQQVSSSEEGVFYTFETFSPWRRGDEANGTFQQSSTESREGTYSGRLRYNFGTEDNDYVVFSQRQSIPGEPNQITAWVYGDSSGHYLNVWLDGRGSETWQFTFGQVNHTGWKQMRAIIDPDLPWPVGRIDGTSDSTIAYPVSFNSLVLDDVPDPYEGSGDIYIDNLAAINAPIPTETLAISGTNGITGTPASGSTRPAPSRLTGRIAFDVSRTAGTAMEDGVYIMSLADREPQRLSGFASQPHLGRQGNIIAWKGQDGIYQIDMTGNWVPVQRTFDQGHHSVSVGNSTNKLAYINATGLYLLDGAIPQLLVNGDDHPTWDPDDNWLVYTYNKDIYKVLFTDLQPVQIGRGEFPNWGPDRRIVYTFEGNIYAMDENGNGVVQLTDNPAQDYDPAWSPDGSKIVFVSERDGNAELYVMNANGSNEERLTDTPYWETHPSWGR